MKVLAAGLASQTPVTVYDKTKPYMAGRVFQKSITSAGSTALCYGPPLSGFANTFLDTGLAPVASNTTPNGRLFQIAAISAGVATVILYSFDLSGQTPPAYIGKINLLLPNQAATTHTVRAFEVWDGATSGVTTGWQIMIGTTGSVPANGGSFVASNISLTDFAPISAPTIGMALGNNAKAVYWSQDTAAFGAANNFLQIQGQALDRTNRKLVIHNGLVAATSFSVIDLSVSPTVASIGTNISSSTTAFAGTSPVAYFNLNAATTTIAAGDQVVFTTTSPANFSVSVVNVAPTAYFARDIQTVGGVVYFNLATTSAGATLVPTSAVTGMTLIRAFGQTGAFWTSTKTSTTLAGFAGTFLTTNSEKVVTPSRAVDPNIPVALDGQVCVFLATTTAFYLFKISDITSGVATLASLSSVNANGTGSDYTTVTIANAVYSMTTGMVIYISNASQMYAKRWVNNAISLAFGGLNTTYYEGSGVAVASFALVTILTLDVQNGWVFIVGSTTGQRGVLYTDFRSDASFGYSYLTSPVVDTSGAQTLNFIETVEKLFDLTSSMVFSYKTKATFADAAFNDPTSGFTVLPTAADLSTMALNNWTQFRIDYQTAQGATNTPAQLVELEISYTGRNEISDNWAFDEDSTTVGTSTPSYVAFQLSKAYTASVPQLYVRGYDASGNLLFSYDTVSSAASFSYSTNSGTSWTALGTIPNTVGTKLRVNIASPPGVTAYMSIRES